MRACAAGLLIIVACAGAAAQAPERGAARVPDPGAGQSPLPATDVTAAQVKAFIDALPRDAVSDRPIRVASVGGYQVGVYGVFRPRTMPGDAIKHETTTSEIYYMLRGSGTLVTGGTIAGTNTTVGAASENRGDRIEGGVTRKVVPGDIVIIPGRTPHWWRQLDGDIEYLIFRPDPDSRLTPR
jgi:mannose-6-phosphate isomerase-like protein (cupin superfamily)